MAEFQNIEVKGLSELAARLRTLPDKIARNTLRGAVAAGAAVIRKEAKLRAPVWTGPVSKGHPPPGTLKRAIYQKQIRELSSLYNQVFYVGVRQGRQRSVRTGKKVINLDAYYWRWVEFGRSGQAARPFLRPAFVAKREEALNAMRNYLAARIEREASR